MQFDEERLEGVLTIRRYDEQGFQLGQQYHQHPLLITPRQVTELSRAQFQDTDALKTVIAEMAGASDDAVLILGTGKTQQFPETARLKSLMQTATGASRVVEVMDTGAACRTYNLLAGDGRAVIAAMLVAGDEGSS